MTNSEKNNKKRFHINWIEESERYVQLATETQKNELALALAHVSEQKEKVQEQLADTDLSEESRASFEAIRHSLNDRLNLLMHRAKCFQLDMRENAEKRHKASMRGTKENNVLEQKKFTFKQEESKTLTEVPQLRSTKGLELLNRGIMMLKIPEKGNPKKKKKFG